MNLFCSRVIKKNKFTLVMLLLLFSLLSAYMPFGMVEAYEHHNYESLFNYTANSSKPSVYFIKLFKKIAAFLQEMFRLPQILSVTAILAYIQLVLFNTLISNVLILYLFSFLLFYFHGGKYENKMPLY
jgi:hypothetical protein